ncbi:MAG TPA: RHS repeat-associated core domain-containing protein, partial [Puia sp.]|nr:RHS repeat-associated core domain-containing protein [Puia sp.]
NLPSLVTFANNKGTIQYFYDAAGARLKKQTYETAATVNLNGTNYSTSITTITTYIGNFVYQSKSYSNGSLAALQYTDQLLFSGHEQGRIRFIPAIGTAPAAFVFDYFVRDNQGNTRVVLTTENQSDIYPAATLETATYNGGTAESQEAQYYNISTADCIATSSLGWWSAASGSSYNNENNSGNPANPNPYSNVTATSSQVYQLNGNTNGGIQSGDRFGLGITLKVMSGDQISIFGKSVYHLNTGSTIPTGSYPVSAVLASFLSAFANTAVVGNVTHGTVTGTTLNNASSTTGPLTTTLNNVPSPADPTHTPKAGLNWILFDDQFRPKASGFEPVNTTADVVKTHNSLINIPMVCNGYLYVFASNESNINVYFDNLQVVHTRGAMVEETHYYPEGLTMAGISDHAWNKQLNFYHYEGKEMQNTEFSDASGLEEYDFGARFYDPQLGRWTTQDPAGQFASPYTGMANNWPNGVDRDGKVFVVDDLLEAMLISAIIESVTYVGMNFLEGGSWNTLTFKGVALAAAEGALAGALGYGTSQLAASLFGPSFGQSFGYNFMSHMALGTGESLAAGNKVTWGSIAGSAIGALIDGSLPNFKGFARSGSGDYTFWDGLFNAGGELVINSARGAVTGGIGGAFGAAIDNQDPGQGFVNGAKSGLVSAAARTGLNIVILGPTIRPNDAEKQALVKMQNELKTDPSWLKGVTVDVDLVNDPYGPIYRTGGIWGRGLSVGISHEISNDPSERKIDDVATWVHETFHYYQVLTQGWQTELWKGAMEQWFYHSQTYEDAYADPATNEGAANNYQFNGHWH